MSSIKAALRVGQPTLRRTVQRYARTIRQNVDLLRNSAAHTRAARLAHIDELLFGEKGNPEWNERRMFSKDALDFFARVVKLYTTLGWPMDRGRAPRRKEIGRCCVSPWLGPPRRAGPEAGGGVDGRDGSIHTQRRVRSTELYKAPQKHVVVRAHIYVRTHISGSRARCARGCRVGAAGPCSVARGWRCGRQATI